MDHIKQIKELTTQIQYYPCQEDTVQNDQINRDMRQKEDVEAMPQREIKQYVDPKQPNVPQKVVTRKLSKRVVFISKTIDVVVSTVSVVTSTVVVIKSALSPKDAPQLVIPTAVVGAVCGCVGTIKSKVLDALKGCAKDYNAEQPAIK